MRIEINEHPLEIGDAPELDSVFVSVQPGANCIQILLHDQDESIQTKVKLKCLISKRKGKSLKFVLEVYESLGSREPERVIKLCEI